MLYTYRGKLAKFIVPVARERDFRKIWKTRETLRFDIWSLSSNQMCCKDSTECKQLGLHFVGRGPGVLTAQSAAEYLDSGGNNYGHRACDGYEMSPKHWPISVRPEGAEVGSRRMRHPEHFIVGAFS